MYDSNEDKTLSEIRTAIWKAVPDDLKRRLSTTTITQSSGRIITALRNTAPRILEAKEKVQNFPAINRIFTYTDDQTLLRRRKIQEAYYNIKNEHKYVTFDVNSMHGDPIYH